MTTAVTATISIEIHAERPGSPDDPEYRALVGRLDWAGRNVEDHA